MAIPALLKTWRCHRGPVLRLVMLCGLLALAPMIQAKDVALLIGIGHYLNPSYNLNGIDKDLDLMHTVARRLGFAEPNIRTLADAEVTTANIERAFHDWLAVEAGVDDRVLLYFSGHGSQIPDRNGDEQDGHDEVLTMHDLKVIDSKGAPTLNGVLADDDLYRLLKTLRSKQVFVLVDACHSGTSAKGAGLTPVHRLSLKDKRLGVATAQSKFFYYPGMSVGGGQKMLAMREAKTDADGFAMLAAAADHERALATTRGSVFTLGVWQAVENAIREGDGPLTLERLKNETEVYIARYIETEGQGRVRHTPQLMGPRALAQHNLLVSDTSPGDGVNAARVQQLIEVGEPLAVSLIGGDRLLEGDLLRLRVEIPAIKGYLNVLEIDANDQVRVLYPNQRHPDNQVRRGSLELPDPTCYFGEQCFDWPIQAPFGPSRIVAIFTRRPLNLFEASDGQRTEAGAILDAFPLISFASTRGAMTDAAFRAGMVRFQACPYDRPCD